MARNGRYHKLGDRSAFGDPLLDECVCKNYLSEFDGDVVFVRGPVLSHGGANANRRDRYVLPDVLFRSPKLRT